MTDTSRFTEAANSIGRPEPEDDEGTAAVLEYDPRQDVYHNGYPDGRLAIIDEAVLPEGDDLGDVEFGSDGRIMAIGSPDSPHTTFEPIFDAEKVDEALGRGRKKSKTRVLTAAERAEQQLDAERREREVARKRRVEELEAVAEEKRFTEIDPQRKVTFAAALAVGLLIFVTSALFSFPAVAATAALMLPEWPWLNWVVPGFVEAFLIYFGVDAVIWQARAANARRYSEGQRANSQKMSNGAISWQLVFTLVAVFANAAHTFQGYEAAGGLGTWQAWLGIALATLAPFSVVLITKRLVRLVFIYAVKE